MNRIEEATIKFERDEAFAVLCGLSAAIEAYGGEPPEELHDPLYRAVQKFREAFQFTKKDVS